MELHYYKRSVTNMAALHVYLFYSFLGLLACFYIWSRKKNNLKLPPGPRGLPLIGHFHLLGELPHHSLHQLAKKYGPIMSLRFGMIPHIIVSSRQLAKEILQTNDAFFASRPLKATTKYVLYDGKEMAFAPYGEHWRSMRKLSTTELFTVRRINSFTPILKDELWQLMCQFIETSKSDQLINIRHALKDYGFNVITRILMRKSYFGPKANESGEEARDFLDIVDDLMRIGGTVCISDYFPSLGWLDWNIPKVRRLGQKVDKFMRRALEDHRKDKGSPDRIPDFLDILEAHLGTGKEADETIKAMLVDLLLGGTETSASTLEWTLAELLHHPHVILKAQEELDKVVGRDRMVEESDFPNLVYVEAIMKEAFRLHPILTLLLPHAAVKDVKVAGYDIPKGSTVLVNAFAIGIDPETWVNPTKFDPERFINSEMNVLGRDFELLPFGSGRRICVGLPLGLKTVQFGLCNLLHAFHWSCDVDKDSLKEAFGLVNFKAQALQVKVKPRLTVDVLTTLTQI